MTKKQFFYDKTVYLGDTNAEGNVYFANYFRWQGEAREAFYKEFFPIEVWLSGLKIITVNASIEYKKETRLFDQVQIEIKLDNVKHMSAELVFIYRNKQTNDLVANGVQKIAFADQAGKLIPMPEPIKKIADLLAS